jgi:hypothetical protein
MKQNMLAFNNRNVKKLILLSDIILYKYLKGDAGGENSTKNCIGRN